MMNHSNFFCLTKLVNLLFITNIKRYFTQFIILLLARAAVAAHNIWQQIVSIDSNYRYFLTKTKLLTSFFVLYICSRTAPRMVSNYRVYRMPQRY